MTFRNVFDFVCFAFVVVVDVVDVDVDGDQGSVGEAEVFFVVDVIKNERSKLLQTSVVSWVVDPAAVSNFGGSRTETKYILVIVQLDFVVI